MAAGTTGNLAWAERAAATVSEPPESLKAIGYGTNEIPTAAEFNWTLQRVGRSTIRRFETAEDLIQARRAGDLAAPEDLGIVVSSTYPPGIWSRSPYSVMWSVAGDANETEFCADGEYLWLSYGPGPYVLRQRSRIDGSLIATGAGAGSSFQYPFIATAGGTIYVTSNPAGKPRIQAFSRTTLLELYHLDLPNNGVLNALATDGRHVAVSVSEAGAEYVYLYLDTGATFTIVAGWPYDHVAKVNAVALDGAYVVIAGAHDVGHAQIETLSYAGVLVTEQHRTGTAAVNRIGYNGEAIGYTGDTDGGKFEGYFYRGKLSATPRWEDATAGNDVCFLGDRLAVATQSGYIDICDPVDGTPIEHLPWDAGAATDVLRLAYDFDGLFALGDADAGGKRLKRYSLTTQPRLYSVVDFRSLDERSCRAVHSLLQPV